MSQEHADLAHRAWDAFNRRDLETFLQCMDPEVELIPRQAAIEGGHYHGHAGVRTWWRDLLNVFPDFSAEVVEVRANGSMGVVELRLLGHGADSASPFDETVWMAAKLRSGRCVWAQVYSEKAEAFDTAELTE